MVGRVGRVGRVRGSLLENREYVDFIINRLKNFKNLTKKIYMTY